MSDTISGGDIWDCLSDADIDAPLKLLLKERAFSARAFFDVRTGRANPSTLAQAVLDRVKSDGWILLPIHIRFHWASALIRLGSSTASTLAVTIMDSAPSPATLKDFKRIFASMGITDVSTVRYYRQKRYTNDCGLHVILVALILSDHANGTFPTVKMRKFALTAWRTILDGCAKTGTAPIKEDLIGLYPFLSEAFLGRPTPTPKPSGAISGGAGRSGQDAHVPPAPTRTVPVKPIDQPLLRAVDVPRDEIDVDAITLQPDETDFTMDDLRSEGVPIKRKLVQEWFEEIARSCNEKRVTASNAVTKLHTAPHQLKSDAELWPAIERAVKRISERRALIRKDDILQETFAGRARGTLITDTVIDWVLAAAPPTPGWSLLETSKFIIFANSGRNHFPKLTLQPSVGVIVYLPGHFVLLTWHEGRLQLRDSLNNPLPTTPSPLCLRLVGRFLALLGKTGPQNLELVRCNRQATNDCAIESLNNLIHIVTGKSGQMSRGLIDQVSRSSDPYNAKHIWKRAWPTDVPTPRARSVSFTDPVEAEPEPTKEQSTASTIQPILKVSCSLCNRPTLAEGFCGWHHPKIAQITNRPNCEAPTNKRTGCCELAIRIAGVNHCQYHLSTHERSKVLSALAEPVQPPAPKEPTRSYTIGDGSRAIPHSEIRRLLQHVGIKASIEVKFQAHGAQLMTVRARLSQVPRGTSILTPGLMSLTARFCPTCGEWHRREDIDLPIPVAGVTYFNVTTNVPNETIPSDECDPGDAGSDASDGDLQDDEDRERAGNPEDIMRVIGRETLSSLPTVSVSHTLANISKHWCIVKSGEKPPHIPSVVWKALSQGSRDVHIRWLQRLKHHPPALGSTNISTAAVETVMRLATERKWAWSTIASALSAMASALGNLRCYTNQLDGIDLRSDPFYKAALQYSQKQARIHSINPKNCTPMSLEMFNEKSKALGGHTGSWVLWQLSWYLAARVGDVRRLDPKNVSIEETSDENGTVAVRALFTQGKGAYFWGPYTIHARLPAAIAKVVREYCSSISGQPVLCNTPDQRRISDMLREVPGYSIRSIRRGSLVHYARCGASDSNLLKLSGHKNIDTLLRYLGWGSLSSEATAAASERSRLEHQHLSSADERGLEITRFFPGDRISGAGPDPNKPMWMGQFSGFNGKKGKRIAAPPDLFPKNAPSAKELGITDRAPSSTDQSQWKLHVKKDLPCLKLEELAKIVETPELRELLALIREWIEQPSHYGVKFPALAPAQIPFAGMTDQQIITMLEGPDPKVRPMQIKESSHFAIGEAFASIENPYIVPLPEGTLIHCGVRAFVIPQELKERLRPIFVPLYNMLINKGKLPPLTYPSRLERRKAIASAKYFIQFDFSAFYDQIKLAVETQSYHVLRTRTPIVCNGVPYTLFALTREPMGSTHSAHVAQYITWCLLEPILRMKDVQASTMIDNVAIYGNDRAAFVKAVSTFLERCRRIGATLNDADTLPRTEEEIIEQGTVKPQTFLGEVFHADGSVSNTTNNVNKLRLAYERIQQALTNPDIVVTKRQVAALVGLWTWLSHTINLSVNSSFEMLRLHSSISASKDQWDDPIKLSVTDVNTIGKAIATTLANSPARPIGIPPPSTRHADYAATVIVDASRTGFGALVLLNGHVLEVKGGFYSERQHSAHAEPLAASVLLEWIRSKTTGPLAIVTDHIALVQGQRRPLSGKGGFSKSYFLNAFFQNLYSDNLNHQVFYIPGNENPADAASRSNKIGDPITATLRPDTYLPDLSTLFHPFIEQRERPWWIV